MPWLTGGVLQAEHREVHVCRASARPACIATHGGRQSDPCFSLRWFGWSLRRWSLISTYRWNNLCGICACRCSCSADLEGFEGPCLHHSVYLLSRWVNVDDFVPETGIITQLTYVKFWLHGSPCWLLAFFCCELVLLYICERPVLTVLNYINIISPLNLVPNVNKQ